MDVHSLKGFDPSPYMASLNHSNQLTANTVVPLSTHHFINYSIPSHTIINYYQVPKKYRSPPTITPSTGFLKINWIIIITFPFPISIAISYHIPSGKLT